MFESSKLSRRKSDRRISDSVAIELMQRKVVIAADGSNKSDAGNASLALQLSPPGVRLWTLRWMCNFFSIYQMT